jgi:hypothetical protein
LTAYSCSFIFAGLAAAMFAKGNHLWTVFTGLFACALFVDTLAGNPRLLSFVLSLKVFPPSIATLVVVLSLVDELWVLKDRFSRRG